MLQFMGSQRVGHNLVTEQAHLFILFQYGTHNLKVKILKQLKIIECKKENQNSKTGKNGHLENEPRNYWE